MATIMSKIDYLLDRITMYHLVLYVLIGQIGVAVILAFFSLLPFSPVALLISTFFLLAMCWATNTVLERIFAIPANLESSAITALILALIIDPVRTASDFEFLGWAAILAISSKYILSINNKHIFNPAAIAVIITSYCIQESASWWIGTQNMLPVVIISGYLVVRKISQEDMVISFLITAFALMIWSKIQRNSDILVGAKQLLVESPLLFFASIMLTEPLTEPPTKNLRRIFGIIIGIFIVPQFHIGTFYFTPELALVIGNIFAYLVSSKQRVALILKRKNVATPYLIDFEFIPTQRLSFNPGQYIECTLGHSKQDNRGNRRYLTIASSPTENIIHLGVRFYEKGSSFKRAMYTMDSRTQVMATQIAGDFTLPSSPNQKLVFIAGGIGITPFRSMVKYISDTNQKRDITLMYANKNVKDILYVDVWEEASRKFGMKAFYTLTDTRSIPPNWRGYRGRINEQMILYSIPDFSEHIYYLSGPPDMVKGFEQALKNIGVKSNHIKKDFFPGRV
jgi:ferredoxin-NADP reductase/Na+-transporting NADH:ubiquinone oxidoreductase subunit NqrB